MASAADVLPDPADELPGLVVEHRFAGPAQIGDTGHPEIGELASGVAPSPSGPTTCVPIFLYHYIRIISLHQAVVAIRNHATSPSRPVVLTFDDGYSDFYTAALPVMASHGFTATDFVITGRMGLPGFMTPSQVVAADGVMDLSRVRIGGAMLLSTFAHDVGGPPPSAAELRA